MEGDENKCRYVSLWGHENENLKCQENMTLLKEYNNFSVPDSKDTKISSLPGKEFQITVLKTLSWLQKTQKDDSTKSESNTWTV